MKIIPLYEKPESIHTISLWAFGHWYVNSGIKFSAVEADYRRRADFSDLPVTWIAVDNDLPVGMVSMKEFDLLSHKHLSPWLSALYVIPEYRKHGIAAKLIDTVLSFAQEKNFPMVNLFTDNRRGDYLLNYYLKRGWTQTDRTYDYSGKPTNVMSFKVEEKVPLFVDPHLSFDERRILSSL